MNTNDDLSVIGSTGGDSAGGEIQGSSVAENQSHKWSKVLVGLISAVVIILLAGAALGAYFAYNYFSVSPEKLMLQAVDNMQDMDSGKINLEMQLSVKPKVDMAMTGGNLLMPSSDLDIKAGLKTSFDADGDFVATASEINFDLPTGASLPLVGEVTVSPVISIVSADKENLYLKIKGIPPLPMYDLTEFNDQWIQINYQELTDQYGLKINPAEQTDSEQFKANQEKFVATYKKYPFFSLKKLSDEEIEGENCHHLQADLDKGLLKQFLLEVIRLQETEDALPAGSADNYAESIDEALKDSTIFGEIWIAKQSVTFKKIFLSILSDTESTIAEVKVTALISEINQPQNIAAPADAMSFKEASEKMMMKMMSGQQMDMDMDIDIDFDDEDFSADLDSDNDGLTDTEELMYGTDPDNPDSDGDGYRDGEEVENGYDPNGPGQLN